jgi:hypothetical protein
VTRTPLGTPHPNFSPVGLPAYYANWFRYVTGRESWAAYVSGFPSPVGIDAREAALIRQTAGTDGGSLLVLGGAPWLYVEAGLAPVGPDPFVVDNFPTSPGADPVARALLAARVPSVVVLAPNAPAWALGACRNAGYREVPSAPWPTFRR